ncbi:YjjG family noncanonical pyrimidine nucleotidase [Flavobacterium silvaticum]|uniref:Noncanonical pyrimidine nucleotidase, YjjG family n=1 Tax=Flavobacterium silvaticum TaxID=1852020 RepID=A0A972FX21_9FLAO|nr:YjjG family noncanonical pyrimidine nucleotidase [Flavobacterium silvaticum]NMH29602.1 noncanonical pyrimidine nucleotidase, YjjG family [Flavobacterium silvaticum]
MKPNHNITDVFFDLDHTLWDFERNSAIAFEQVLAERFPEIPVEDFLEIYIPINREYWLRYQRNEVSQQELRLGRMRSSFAKLGVLLNDSELEEISNRYIELLPSNNHLKPNALELLEYLKPKYKLHIITNGFASVQQKKLENSGIAPYFATVTDSERAGFKKPDKRIYEFALNDAKTVSAQSVMIGDCPEADVAGALNCGMSAIWFDPEEKVTPDGLCHIRDLSEIKNYL